MSTKPALVAFAALALAASAATATAASPTGDTWGPEEHVAVTVVADQEQPALVRIRPDGSAVAAWIAADDETPGPLTVARRGPGGHWSAPEAVSPALEEATPYDLAVGPRRAASVVWQGATGADRVDESHLVSGSWTTPHRLGPGTSPRTTIDGRGTTTVVWRGGHGVRSARLGSSGLWRFTRLARGPRVGELRVASSTDGDVVAAWWADRTVRAVVRTHGSRWTSAHTLHRYRSRQPYITGIQVAVDRTGRSLVAWEVTGIWQEGLHEYANHVAWSRGTAEGVWTAPRLLTTSLGEDGGGLRLSMSPSGAALATWVQIHRSDSSPFARAARFRPDGTWTRPAAVSSRRVVGALHPWLDRRGVAHVLVNAGWRNVSAFRQAPGHAWSTGSVVGAGRLVDVAGAGRHLLALTEHHGLSAVLLTVGR